MIEKSFLFLMVALTQLQLDVAQRLPVYETRIPGTKLETTSVYKLGLKRFPSGTVTWTERVNASYNYVITDNDPGRQPLYDSDGERYQDALWEFKPVLYSRSEQTGWYSLRNRGRWFSRIVYEPTDSANGGPQSYHLVLDKTYAYKDPEETYYVKPVAVNWRGETFYQLKFKNLPNAAVTWTANPNKWHYIQLDGDQSRKGKYAAGGEWYEDTLFTVTAVEDYWGGSTTAAYWSSARTTSAWSASS